MAARDARAPAARPSSRGATGLSPISPFDPHAASREMARRKAEARGANASHWHVAPASFLILGFVGTGLSGANAASWLWIAALALNVIVRLVLPAPVPAAPAGRYDASDSGQRWRAVSYLIDALLWGGLVISIDPMPAQMATRVGGALAGAILISSLSSASRTTPLALALGWLIPLAAIALHASSGNVIALGLLLWLASVVWLGATRPAPMPTGRAARTSMPAILDEGSTRRGIQLAIQASAAPMMAIHDGRIFEINAPAAELLGRVSADCVGLPATEIGAFEPPDALARAQASNTGSVSALLRPRALAADRALPVRIKVGKTRSGDPVCVLALQPPEPAPPAAQAPQTEPRAAELPDAAHAIEVTENAPAPISGRASLPDLLSKLPVLAWVVDGDGRIVHTHIEQVRRWGMRTVPGQQHPRWWDAFVYRARSRETFLQALKSALAGKPTYDLLIERDSPSGGRLALRTHVVPLQWPDAQGKDRSSALVLDTIASAHELLEVDRLRRRKDHYKSLVEASPNLIWACDANFRFTFVSRRACRDLYGYAVEDLVGVSMGVLLNPAADQTAARRALVGLQEGRIMRDVEMAHVTKDGRRIIVAVSAAALSGTDRRFAGAVGMMVDLTALKQREASLAEALRVERSVLDSAGQALAVVRGGEVARCNEALLQLLQCTAAQLQGMRIVEIFSDRAEWAGAMAAADRAALTDQAVVREIKLRRPAQQLAEEQTVWCQLTLRSIDQGEYVLALADIDSIRRREAHALFDARHDELTGLANRRLFAERARAALATSALRNSGCAIVVIDLDRFKQVNDRYGHQAGDQVLQEMARRLQRVVRPQDTVARYGGDEFALLIPDAGTRRDIEAIALRIIDELARPVHFGGTVGTERSVEETLSASVGIALAWEQGREPSWLLSLADRAMYEAKAAGGNRAVFAPMIDPLPETGDAPGANPGPAVGRAA